MRNLKFHEKKLLRKVDFLKGWPGEKNHREVQVTKRYHVQERADYDKYIFPPLTRQVQQALRAHHAARKQAQAAGRRRRFPHPGDRAAAGEALQHRDHQQEGEHPRHREALGLFGLQAATPGGAAAAEVHGDTARSRHLHRAGA